MHDIHAFVVSCQIGGSCSAQAGSTRLRCRARMVRKDGFRALRSAVRARRTSGVANEIRSETGFRAVRQLEIHDYIFFPGHSAIKYQILNDTEHYSGCQTCASALPACSQRATGRSSVAYRHPPPSPAPACALPTCHAAGGRTASAPCGAGFQPAWRHPLHRHQVLAVAVGVQARTWCNNISTLRYRMHA
jgi:hypothetical protein